LLTPQSKGKEFAVKKIPFSITYGTFSVLDEFKIQETLLHENVAMVYEVCCINAALMLHLLLMLSLLLLLLLLVSFFLI
jgi:hypothetical protein